MRRPAHLFPTCQNGCFPLSFTPIVGTHKEGWWRWLRLFWSLKPLSQLSCDQRAHHAGRGRCHRHHSDRQVASSWNHRSCRSGRILGGVLHRRKWDNLKCCKRPLQAVWLMIDDNFFQGFIQLLVNNFRERVIEWRRKSDKHNMMNKTLDFHWQWWFFHK